MCVILPHLFRGLLDESHMKTLLLFVELVFYALQPHLDQVSLHCMRDIVDELLPALKSLKSDLKFKIGGPSAHNLMHLLDHAERFGGAVQCGVQRLEARHGQAKRDRRSTQRSILCLSLIQTDAMRLGMRSAIHGSRWNFALSLNPNGQFAAGHGWRLRTDPHSPGMSHFLIRALTQYAPLTDDVDSKWLFNVRGVRKGHGDNKTPDVQLSHEQLEQLRRVYLELKLQFDDAKLPDSLAVLKSATVGNQTYMPGDDALAKFASDDGEHYLWPIRIHSIFSHSPVDGKQAVWFRFCRYQEVRVRREPYKGTINRQVYARSDQPDEQFYSPSVLDSPVAFFHYCRLDLENADAKESKERKHGAPQKTEFKTQRAVEQNGPACGVRDVEECRLHSARDCADIQCATPESRHVVKRFIHDHMRALYAIERHWRGH